MMNEIISHPLQHRAGDLSAAGVVEKNGPGGQGWELGADLGKVEGHEKLRIEEGRL